MMKKIIISLILSLNTPLSMATKPCPPEGEISQRKNLSAWIAIAELTARDEKTLTLQSGHCAPVASKETGKKFKIYGNLEKFYDFIEQQ